MASEPQVKKNPSATLCLTMIVKNESKVILRCLNAVKDYLDYWVICDTGSTDNTKEIIKDFFAAAKIPGELLEHKWKNFGYNRSQAISASRGKADYCLLMDADFIFKVNDPNFKEKMGDADGYHIRYEGNLDYRQMLCVRSSLNWRYIGVTHEYIYSKDMKSKDSFDGFSVLHAADGGCRSDKFERDIEMLLAGLEEEPTNSRYMFYLAQSYKDTAQYDNAIKYYEKRIGYGGWHEEMYYAMYQKGKCKRIRGDEFYAFMPDLLRAYHYHPKRLEALYELVKECRTTKRYLLGYRLGRAAKDASYPKNDVLFIEKAVHEWMFLDEFSLCAFYAGKHQEALDILLRILNEKKYPEYQEKRFQEHLKFYREMVEQVKSKRDSEISSINTATSSLPKA